MSHATIWIDHQKAHLFEFKAEGVKEKIITNSHHGKADKEHQRKFYHEVAEALGHPKEIFIVGPGTAKEEFQNHCESHHQDLQKSIVGIEPMKDHPRESEIIAVSRKFFSKYYNWVGV